MEQMNFPVKWSWIMACVTSARSSVLVNGSPTSEFACYRGLRQGDPLSPFLFIISMEALTCVMKRALNLGLYHGLKCTASGPHLSHFLYADDVVFLGSWSDSNAKNLCRILRCFNLASGLKVNLLKCQLFGTGIDSHEMDRLAGIFRCKVGSLPFTYLGLKVGANMNLVKNWKPVVDVFRDRLSNWKAKRLSYGGRITLVKSVLNSLPTYFFSLYKAPDQVIGELDLLRRRFLWGGSEEKAKMCWVSWDKVTSSVESGGLGLGSLRDANSALLAKWWWRFKVEHNRLWRNVIWSLHSNSRAWSYIPIKISRSGTWKQIYGISSRLSARGIDISKLIRGIVGEGSSIYFWRDVWLGSSPLAELYPSLFALEKRKDCWVANRVRVLEGELVVTWDWNRPPNADEEMVDLDRPLGLLNAVNWRSAGDRWKWQLEPSGCFSVSSIKTNLERVSGSTPNYKFKWNPWVPKKVSIVAWRAEKDRLPTVDALIRRNIPVQDTWCGFCGDHMDTMEHVILACDFAQDVWQVISMWCKAMPFFAADVRDLLDSWKFVRGSSIHKNVVHAITLITIWSIWRLRNSVRLGNGEVSLVKIVEEIKVQGYLWVCNRSVGDPNLGPMEEI
ncbi:hypothetical protein L1987_14776 [Smallanthus sonchifolius]|uniref:Uncharacterized protein n=1 Tax=Smallanthus sonchifolius TaxID=185202 RepID=A0ACB9J6B4_9ASTR|nr:hypothetical protein L1987_14776 [Smallanthus sonchifolius]